MSVHRGTQTSRVMEPLTWILQKSMDLFPPRLSFFLRLTFLVHSIQPLSSRLTAAKTAQIRSPTQLQEKETQCQTTQSSVTFKIYVWYGRCGSARALLKIMYSTTCTEQLHKGGFTRLGALACRSDENALHTKIEINPDFRLPGIYLITYTHMYLSRFAHGCMVFYIHETIV